MDNMTPFTQKDRARVSLVTLDAARKLLRYAFVDIDFQYDQLTDTEWALVTREEFDRMVAQLKLR